jgi:hypothetical protein
MRILLVSAVLALFVGCQERAIEPAPVDQKASENVVRPDNELVLDAILALVLHDEAFKGEREFYGTLGDKQLALVTYSNYGVPWPANYQPAIEGYSVQRVTDPKGGADKTRLLGVRIDKFDLDQKESGFRNSPIEICILNAGGSKNGAVIGGCSVYCTAKRDGVKWVIEVDEIRDP